MIEKVGFAKIHVFPYSRREGTKAAAMPGQLSNAQKEQRARGADCPGRGRGTPVPGRICGPGGRSITGEPLPNGAWVGYTPEYLRVELPCRNGAQGQYRRVRAAACTVDGLLGEEM